MGVLFAGGFGICGLAIDDERNASVRGDFRQKNVAPNPSMTAGCGGEWRTFLNSGNGKGEARNEKNVADFPVGEFVMKRDEIWSFVCADFLQHGCVCGVHNLAAE